MKGTVLSLNIPKIITSLTLPDAKAPIVALETTVTGGRTIQAKKRGGKNEARERLIEEASGAVFWLWGVSTINNYIGDPLLEKLFGGKFDVGTDKVLRTPFENFMRKNPPKGFSAKQVALIKAIKVLASVVIADSFIGLVVPPLNQKLTRTLINKEKSQKDIDNTQDKLKLSTTEDKKEQTQSTPSFKGAISAINVFTNAIENTNTGKLLSTDVGLTGGRIYSARNNDERREIAFRDIVSIYFYMWAQGHVGNILNLILTGKADRINPNSTANVHEHLYKFLEAQGGEMDVQAFKKAVLGKKSSDIKLPEGIKFATGDLSAFTKFMNKFRSVKTEPLQVANVEDLKGLFSDEIFARIQEMSKIQPKRQGVSVITKQQIIDAINIAEINDPKFLDRLFSDYTGGHYEDKSRTFSEKVKDFFTGKTCKTGKYIEGASKDEFRFVSNEKLYNLKQQVEDYINLMCKDAKDGKITLKTLEQAKKKNIVGSGFNFVVGFATAAVFLSTIIPKVQYWITRVKTGKNEFPGTYEFNENKEIAKA